MTEAEHWVHLEVTAAEEIYVGLPDADREVVVKVALTPAGR